MRSRTIRTIITLQFTAVDGRLTTTTEQASCRIEGRTSEEDVLTVAREATIERLREKGLEPAPGCTPVVMFWKIMEDSI